MSLKLALMGLGISGLGIFYIVWYIVKLIACIMIAGYISIRAFGLSGMYWWFSSIVIFSILAKILFSGNGTDGYKEITDKYAKLVDEENVEFDNY